MENLSIIEGWNGELKVPYSIEDKESYMETTKIESDYLIKNPNNEDEYVKNLKQYLFSSMDITNGSFKYKDILEKTQMNKKSLMRLVKEISSIQNSLPVSFSSSVFFRTDTESINAVKFIVKTRLISV